MSWPSSYSGGGQVYPQQNQDVPQIQNQLLQMMQLQMQRQRNIQLQKQLEFNPPKNTIQNKPNSEKEDTDKNIISSNKTNIKEEKSGEEDSDKSKHNVNAEESNDKNNSQSLDSESIKHPSNKSITKPLYNKPPPTNTANYQNKREPVEPKVEPPSPRANIFNDPKGPLMGLASLPLLPNQPPPPPPPPLPETLPPEINVKGSYSENPQNYYQNQAGYSMDQPSNKDYQQYQHNYQGQQNYEQSMPGYQQGQLDSTNQSHQDYNTNLQNSNRPNKSTYNNDRQNHVEDYQYDTCGRDSFGNAQGGSTHWQQQSNFGGTVPRNDRQSQQDFANNAYQGGGTDYSRGASGGSIYQNDYDQHNRYSRNINVGSERSAKPGPPPYGKREQLRGFYGSGSRLKDKFESAFTGPMTDLSPIDISEKKFNFYAKVFVGNIPRNAEEDELLALFNSYGEIGQTYFNKDASFGFITFDYKANAAKAVRAVDNKILKGRYLKVRFAQINEGIRVKNLSPYTSNELLEKAFAVFGTIESCRVLVDDRGNPKFEGIVVFKEKRSAGLALKTCQEDCFYLSGAMRPAIVVPLEPCEDNVEGYPESVILQDEAYLEERKVTPHIADPNSFEFEFGNNWKKLYAMYDEKKAKLDNDFQIELERLEKKMVLAKVEFETEKLRRELAEQEARTAQLRKSFGTGSFSEKPASPAPYRFQYPEAGAARTAYPDDYGKTDPGYEAGYDAQYSGEYGNTSGYGKPSDNTGNPGADYDGMYGQQGRGYGAGYGGPEYGQPVPGDGYGMEPDYDRSIVGKSAPDDKMPMPPLPPARGKYDYEAHPEPPPPSYKNSSEPLAAEKDPYQVPSKRPRY